MGNKKKNEGAGSASEFEKLRAQLEAVTHERDTYKAQAEQLEHYRESVETLESELKASEIRRRQLQERRGDEDATLEIEALNKRLEAANLQKVQLNEELKVLKEQVLAGDAPTSEKLIMQGKQMQEAKAEVLKFSYILANVLKIVVRPRTYGKLSRVDQESTLMGTLNYGDEQLIEQCIESFNDAVEDDTRHYDANPPLCVALTKRIKSAQIPQLIPTLRALKTLAYNEDNVQSMLENKAFELVVDAMRNARGNIEVATESCGLLAGMTTGDLSIVALPGDTFSLISSAMRSHAHAYPLHKACLQVFSGLCRMIDPQSFLKIQRELIDQTTYILQADIREKSVVASGLDCLGVLRAEEVEGNRIAGFVLETVKAHIDTEELVDNAFTILRSVAVTSEGVSTIMDFGGFPLVLAAMNNHPKVYGVQVKACTIIKCVLMADQKRAMTSVSTRHRNSPINLILLAMSNFPKEKEVQREALGALACFVEKESRTEIGVLGGVDHVLACLATFVMERQIQADGCQVLRNVAEDNAQYREVIGFKGGISQLKYALKHYMSHEDVVGAALGCLENLCFRDPNNMQVTYKEGLIKQVLSAMKNHIHAADVQKSGCALIWIMAYDDEQEYRRTFFKEGAIPAVIRALQLHTNDASVQEAGCCALWNMAADHPKARNEMCRQGAVQVVIKAMKNHPDSLRLQIMAVGALSQFTDRADVSQAVAKEGGPKLILTAMRYHPEAELQRLSATTVHNLAHYIPTIRPSLSGQDGFVQPLLEALKAYPQHMELQREGLKALALLCKDKSLPTWDENRRLVVMEGGGDIINYAMRQYSDDHDIRRAGETLLMSVFPTEYVSRPAGYGAGRSPVPGTNPASMSGRASAPPGRMALSPSPSPAPVGAAPRGMYHPESNRGAGPPRMTSPAMSPAPMMGNGSQTARFAPRNTMATPPPRAGTTFL